MREIIAFGQVSSSGNQEVERMPSKALGTGRCSLALLAGRAGWRPRKCKKPVACLGGRNGTRGARLPTRDPPESELMVPMATKAAQKQGEVLYVCYPSSQEAEAGRLGVQSQLCIKLEASKNLFVCQVSGCTL